MKRYLSILVTFVLIVTMVGCTQNSETGTTTMEQNDAEVSRELTFVNFRDIRDLNPHLYAGEMYAQSIIYDRLVNITETGYAPALAESWEISEDGRVYTFFIREGVKFSDGTVCDAHAIKANFDAIIENKERHTWLGMMNLLQEVHVVDELTLEIILSEPYYPMLTELGVTRPFGMISPAAMINGSTKDGVLAYIGTGPYKLTDFVVDEYAVFEVNEYYWGEKPAIEKITVRVIPDNQARVMALEKGEIDIIYGKNMVDINTLVSFQNSDLFDIALSEPTSTRHILMNSTHDILSDKEVRQALQHATNRSEISEGLFYGLEQPADFLYATSVPYANVGLEPYSYDLDKAQSMLEAAGWIMNADGIREKEGQTLSFELLYNANSVMEKKIGEYLQGEYKKIGIELILNGEEKQSYLDKMKSGQFDMSFNSSWGLPYDPQSSLAAMRVPVHGDFAAQQGLNDKAAIDEAITAILVSTDESARQALYKDVLTRLHEEALYLPLTYERNKAIYRKGLSGVTFSANPFEVPFHTMTFTK
ncbi:MAG: nickel ABC transporter substrate-binding protein [Alkaliphilus sp.]|nr:nickel ABC transporter substrate-binding protein [Alkaliphilus sp.]